MNKKILRAAVARAAGVLPKRRRVLLESNPDLADNVYPVFVHMLADPFFSDVELLWLVKDSALWRERFPQKNVRFVDFDPDEPRSRMRGIRLALTSQCVLTCNKTLWSPAKGQLSLFLGHGTPIKACKGFYTPGPFCNRWSYPSKRVKQVMEEQLGLAPEQGMLLGYPRNDALQHPAGALDRLVDRRGRKVLFWLPTFRQHTIGYDSNYALSGCGLPLLTEADSLERLNAALERESILMVLKPHPVQDMSAIRAKSHSSFQLLYDDDLRRAGIQLYEALADADGLLTDYSSVYCDFLLTGKPIGLTFDDLEQYTRSRGLVMDDPRELVKGRYLYTLSDLEEFLGELHRGEDPAAQARAQANDYYNDWRDGASAARVAQVLRRFLEKGAL